MLAANGSVDAQTLKPHHRRAQHCGFYSDKNKKTKTSQQSGT